MTDENAKDPKWKTPVNLPGVKPSEFPNINQSGVDGFSPQYGGVAKARQLGSTSSFDAGASGDAKHVKPSGEHPAGQEEGGRERQATTSVVGRVDQ